MNSEHIATQSYLHNLDVEPPKLDRADYAAGLAQLAFRSAYSPPSESGWRDRSPAEVRAARYTMASGKYAGSGECQKVAFNPVGQVVGQINEIESCRDIVFRLLSEYGDAIDHINAITPQE